MGLGDRIKQRASDVGFDLAGIAPLSAWRDLEFSRQWVEQGYGGEMRYLANPKRHDPRRILPSSKSIVCVGLIYNADRPYSTEIHPEGKDSELKDSELTNSELSDCELTNSELSNSRGWISRYAWGRDYHQVMRSKLEKLRAAIESMEPAVETRVYVDTGPVVERAFARYSGIGWTGKNTCLINQDKGSWFFIGVILTSLAVDPDLPAPDRCGSCTRCLEACPTGALVQPYVMDASRCIAYFTIEVRGSLPLEFRPAIGANVFGCDICQDVCPWNGVGQGLESEVRRQESGVRSQTSELSHPRRRAAITDLSEFQPLSIERTGDQVPVADPGFPSPLAPAVAGPLGPRAVFSLFNPPLDALASLTEPAFRRVFAPSPLKRARWGGWLRNLCVAMGNSGDARFVGWLERTRHSPDPIVREHAGWALERLKAEGDCQKTQKAVIGEEETGGADR